jgi:hypothetical protein
MYPLLTMFRRLRVQEANDANIDRILEQRRVLNERRTPYHQPPQQPPRQQPRKPHQQPPRSKPAAERKWQRLHGQTFSRIGRTGISSSSPSLVQRQPAPSSTSIASPDPILSVHEEDIYGQEEISSPSKEYIEPNHMNDTIMYDAEELDASSQGCTFYNL